MSAISHIGDAFSQNPRDLAGWEVALDQGRLSVWRGRRLDDDDVLRAEIIQQLMCQGCIDLPAIERRHEIDFHVYFAESLARLRPLVDDGLATVADRRITVTSNGRLLLRMIAMCLDRYLTEPGAAAPRPCYSRVI